LIGVDDLSELTSVATYTGLHSLGWKYSILGNGASALKKLQRILITCTYGYTAFKNKLKFGAI
jgi:hypothetical protein